MISIEGAGLLAQVLPVGLLIIAVERRALGPEPYPRGRRYALAGWWTLYVVMGLTVAASIISTMLCVIAVSQSEPLEGVSAWIVTVSGIALALVAIRTTVALSMRSYSGRLPHAED